MIKRILLALTLAGALGGAVAACNSPAATTNPSVALPSESTPAGSEPAASAPAASESLPAESPSALPSAS
jgi:hypothetical protein